ncbi:MAG: PQQ-binding-like beta-propeller repeat protein [Bacteroidetes bacterium]|nr:PQQ-binding-like beta-propeller repeat protein [Bacteroidota bacterium]
MKNSLLLLTLLLVVACSRKYDSYNSWPVTGGSKENIRYSSLTQIDTANVKQLQVAWTYHTGDADTTNHSQIQCNPIVVDGVLYGTSPQLKLFAVDAATGKEQWVFDPQAEQKTNLSNQTRFILNNNRGVTYWSNGNEKRILYAAGSFLYSIDATTGKPDLNFGNNGSVNLHDGLGKDVSDLYVAATSPGIIYKNLFILGSRVSEDGDAAPGHIRAYDVITGKLIWIFYTIPHPGEVGYETWLDSTVYKHLGGANSWAGFSLDEKRGIVFAPTGSVSFDFYGGKRKGTDLFGNSILAIEAATGKYLWHFQTIHHDVWDKDLPTAPALITLKKDGKEIDAVAQPTKNGFVFLLERETGKPIYSIEEREVPHQSELKGEELWPTQPFPTFPKPFTRQVLNENDLNDLVSDSSQQELKKRLSRYLTGNMFNPPTFNGTIFFPGLDGGAEWGGVAYDPSTKLLYVNANEMPWILKMKEIDYATPQKETYLKAGQRLYNQYCMACHGTERKGSGNYPAIVNVNKKYGEKTFIELLGTGRRMMPAFINLSNEETSAIASFILDLKSEQKKEFKSTTVTIDSFRHLPYTITGYNKFLTREGYAGIKPPWGTLNAVNLTTGEIEWKIALGEIEKFKKKGITTGSENYGGPVVTASGLVFIAATPDGKLRAFNKWNGKLLWETNLPTPGFATPSVYEANGKQFIVIACGGGKLKTKSGDSYVAFALQ